jgi:hypothetical protein
MPTLEHRSKSTRIPTLLLAALLTLAAMALVRPAAGLAAPEGTPVLSFEPGNYDFGLQPLYDTTQASFELRNEGSETVPIESLNVGGADSGSFWVGESNCWGVWLEPGQSCSAQVNFNPGEARDYSAQLRAVSNFQQYAADLSGSGASALFAPASNPTDFGVAKVGSAGVTREIAISNTGNMPGGMFIAVIAGGAIGSFQIVDENCTGVELAPAATCTVQVRFQPTSEGVKKATLGLFGENDGPTPIVLTGVGSAPDPVPTAASADVATSAAVAAAPQPRRPKAGKRKRGVRKFGRKRSALQSARLVLKAR